MVSTRDGTGTEYTIPVATVSEANRRDHWRTKAKRARLQRWDAYHVTRLHHRPLTSPCVVHLTRVSARFLDCDNLAGAMKAVRDGIADALGIDDRDPRCRWEYAQVKRAKTNCVRVVITTEPAA